MVGREGCPTWEEDGEKERDRDNKIGIRTKAKKRGRFQVFAIFIIRLYLTTMIIEF